MIEDGTVAITGLAAPITITTTNLPGTPAFTHPTALGVGVVNRATLPLMAPVKSVVVNTATTFVFPAATSVIWRANVQYFVAA